MEIMNAPVTHEMKYNPNIVDSYHYSNIHVANEQRRETTNQQRIDIFISYLAHYALVIVEGSSFLLKFLGKRVCQPFWQYSKLFTSFLCAKLE